MTGRFAKDLFQYHIFLESFPDMFRYIPDIFRSFPDMFRYIPDKFKSFPDMFRYIPGHD